MINVLLVFTGNTGLQYHRQISPHRVLDNTTNGIKYNITSTANFDSYDQTKLKDQQIVYFLRNISNTGKTKEVIDRCHTAGAKTILDIDDYWNLPSDHGLYHLSKTTELKKNTEEAIKYSDAVFTTTEFFGTKIKGLNKNTHILPNTIDLNDFQWTSDVTGRKDGIVKYGWIGGVWHRQDLDLLKDSIQYCYNDKKLHNYKFVLGGYTDNQEYNYIQNVMTMNGTRKDKYEAVPSKDYNEYGMIYDSIDVLLVPLRDNLFNNCKSPLKLLEAGAKKKAVIASCVLPYSEFPASTYLQIGKNDNKKGWYKAIKKMQESKQMRQDYAMSLNEYCEDKYNAVKWSMIRDEIYTNLIK